MNFFRIEHSESSGTSWKFMLFGFIILLIIGSFFLQMGMGLCPVP